MVQVGDEVVLFDPFWHYGQNLGDSLSRVVSVKSYVLVNVYDYPNNPVKCFRRDFEVLESTDQYTPNLDHII